MAGGFAFGFGVGAFGLGDEGLAAELDLAALFVDADALDHDFLALAQLIGGVGDTVVGQLTDMQQAVEAWDAGDARRGWGLRLQARRQRLRAWG